MTPETDFARWTDAANLDPRWNDRARAAANYVPAGAAVLDLGCGAMALERFLPSGCNYRPCDLVKRDERTIICDFNQGQFPQDAAPDIVTALGLIEYIVDLDGFFGALRRLGRPAVLSYCPVDLTGIAGRATLGWLNNLSIADLEGLVMKCGFTVDRREQIDSIQVLFRISPARARDSCKKRVLVLSYNNSGNFGDRLGYHLINDIAPPFATVTHCHFHPWNVPPEDYDLLVLGLGNSLFAPLFTDPLLRLLERVPRSIGIFGTQYRHAFPGTAMAAVLDRLTIWFARYQEDALLYGKGRNNVVHLGDWLINAFPMAEPRTGETLSIGDEVLGDLPLDRMIQRIQSARRVTSPRLHPLLCALTSAEQVAYCEQREDGSGQPSGKFRSMLIDVFGRDFPEDRLFSVDRDAVARYRRMVMAGTAELRGKIMAMLSEPAAAPASVCKRE